MGGAFVYVETEETTIVAHTCGKCGVVFGLGERFLKARQEDHQTFWCPNGHGRVFTSETEAEKARKEARMWKQREEFARAAQGAAEAQARAAEYRRRYEKGRMTRLRNKMAAGECPCCQTVFPNVAEHMASEHPDFMQEEGQHGGAMDVT